MPLKSYEFTQGLLLRHPQNRERNIDRPRHSSLSPEMTSHIKSRSSLEAHRHSNRSLEKVNSKPRIQSRLNLEPIVTDLSDIKLGMHGANDLLDRLASLSQD